MKRNYPAWMLGLAWILGSSAQWKAPKPSALTAPQMGPPR